MRDRVTFQHVVTGLDAFGQPSITWVDSFTVWANVTDLSGMELIKSMTLVSDATTTVKIRYRTGIDPTMRIIWEGLILNIKSPPLDPQGRKRMIELLCQRGLQH